VHLHGVHVEIDVAPIALLKVPAKQDVHVAEPIAVEKVPAGHSVALMELKGQ
jgi:hypothetical protein